MKLTQNETLYLADTISIFVEPPPDPIRKSPYPAMVLKIMKAIVVDWNAIHEVEVDFTWDELMLVFEHTRSTIGFGTEKVGLNLLTKASQGILMLNEGKTTLDERIYGEFADEYSQPGTEPDTSNAENRA